MKNMSTGEVGAVSELRACIWLLEQGYEVYRNVTPNGRFDIIAIKDNEIRKIDVATQPLNGFYNSSKQKKARENGGYVLYVNHQNDFSWCYQIDEKYKKSYNCVICSGHFESYQPNRKTCGKEDCQTTQRKLKYDEWRTKLSPS